LPKRIAAAGALDTATEQGILASLRELAAGRSTVTVAHRLSTVMHCDRIIVLCGGRVVEEGTHGELMACGGVYADMWQAQVGEEQVREELDRRRGHSVDVSSMDMDAIAA
jgi:ATP-binding cassette, subfamily B, heavy metal transporter